MEKKIRLCAFADEADASLSGQIDALHENGISLLEIRGVNGKNISALTEAEVKETKKILDGEGIAVWSVGSPLGKYDLGRPLEPHLESFRKIVEFAGILECPRIRMFSFFPSPDDSPEATHEKVWDGLEKFLGLTPDGLLLCHENEKKIYGENEDACLEILRAFPRLKAVFDPANFVQCGVDTAKAWEKLHAYVDYFHIKDAVADGTVVPAGDGIGNLGSLVAKYIAQGGEVMTVEPHLTDFVGLKGLENGESSKNRKYNYANNREAFNAAVTAIKKILSEVTQ